MVSQEFKSAIANNNLLRARIMLKDSFIVDPTFSQLNEMLAYAKQMLPDLFVPFDGDILEEDTSKWNREVMNMELVQLVNNFSEKRIAHLKKVISKVMLVEVQNAKAQRQSSRFAYQHPMQNATKSTGTQCPSSPLPDGTAVSISTPEELRKRAMQLIMIEGTNISKVIQKVKDTKKWEPSQINEIEKAASQLLQATRIYRANRKNR